MNSAQVYVLMGILALAIIAVVVVFVRGKNPDRKMTKLARLAFVFIFAGIIFGDYGFIGYGLMAVGGFLALFDIILKFKKQKLSGFIQNQQEQKEKCKQKILEGINMQKSINNDSVQNLLGVSDATATRYLEELEKEGKIKQVGDTGRGVFYEKV